MRWIWIGGLSLSAIIVAMALTMSIPAATITPDEATLRLFPEDTQGIAYVDVGALRSSALFQEFITQDGGPRFPDPIKEFIAQTGFAIDKDVDSVTIGRLSARDALIVASAHYDRTRVEYFVNSKNIPYETYMGRVIYQLSDNAAVSFIDDWIIGGSNVGVKAAVDRMGSVPPSSLVKNTKLMSTIQTIENGNQIWAAGDFSEDMIPRGLTGPIQGVALLKAFRGGVYQMRIDTGVHVKGTGNFQDNQSAQTAGDLLRGLLAVAKLQVAQQQDMLHLLDGVSIDYSGTTMNVAFDASGDLLKKLKDLKPGRLQAE